MGTKLNGIPKEQAEKLLIQDIDGSVLKDLTGDELNSMGLTIGSKKKLINAIEIL